MTFSKRQQRRKQCLEESSGKSLGSDGGKKTSTYKVKDPLSFEKWIFRKIMETCEIKI
jgi:hypothetical protein